MKLNNSINDKIFEVFRVLKERPLMILSKDDSYELVQNYIEGYIDGLSHYANKNMREEITKWYKKKMKSKTTYHWTGHIPFHFNKKNDNELKQLLIEITESYFKENPNWDRA